MVRFFFLFFLTNKPLFFQNLKFYLLLPDMGGGCEAVSRGVRKKFSRAVKFRTPFFKFLKSPLFKSLLFQLNIAKIFSLRPRVGCPVVEPVYPVPQGRPAVDGGGVDHVSRRHRLLLHPHLIPRQCQVNINVYEID